MSQPPHTDLMSHRFNQRVEASEVISVFTGFCHCGRQQGDFYYFHQDHGRYTCPGETYYEYKKSAPEEEKRVYFITLMKIKLPQYQNEFVLPNETSARNGWGPNQDSKPPYDVTK